MTAPEDDRDWKALVALSASLATREPDRIRAAMRGAAAETDPIAIEEVLLQSHLFLGFPDALNAIALWREVSGLSPDSADPGDPDLWWLRGERVCAVVYAGNYAKLRANVAALHPTMDRWMIEAGYGRVIGRPGLDLATRELCIAALLAVWNVPRQLHSHLRGALNAGATMVQVDAAVEIACGFLVDPNRRRAVREMWDKVRAGAVGRPIRIQHSALDTD